MCLKREQTRYATGRSSVRGETIISDTDRSLYAIKQLTKIGHIFAYWDKHTLILF